LLDAANISYVPRVETPSIPGLGQKVHQDIFAPERHTAFSPATKITNAHSTPHQNQSAQSPLSAASAPEATQNTAQAAALAAPSPEKSTPAEVLPAAPAEVCAVAPEAAETVEAGTTSEATSCPVQTQDTRESVPQPTDAADDEIDHAPEPPRHPLAQELASLENIRYVGILFSTFVAVESISSETLLLIDFHAAHERVLYEELLKASRRQTQVVSQQLLLPPAIELSRTAVAFISKNEKLFAQLGFDVSLLSSNTILLNAVPANLAADVDWESVLSDLVSSTLEGEKHTRNSLEAIARAACHSAVKANDPLIEITAKALLKSLAQCERPDVCPHGRPTVLKISKSELARRFGRM